MMMVDKRGINPDRRESTSKASKLEATIHLCQHCTTAPLQQQKKECRVLRRLLPGSGSCTCTAAYDVQSLRLCGVVGLGGNNRAKQGTNATCKQKALFEEARFLSCRSLKGSKL